MKRKTQSQVPLKQTDSKLAIVALVDSVLMIDKSLTAAKIRKTHLGLGGFFDPETEFYIDEATEFKQKLLDRVAYHVEQHPAYPWFSRIRGIGKENIAKVIALIDINKPSTVSALWKYAGYANDANGKAERRTKGEKLTFNMTLKVMCNRVGTAFLKASALGSNGPSQYGAYYEKEYHKYMERFAREGKKIADFKDIPKNAKPGEYVQSLHLHQMAFRKMIKLFLSHLWEVWREAENLPLRPNYAHDYMDHTKLIDAWEMCDRPAKKTRTKKAA